MVTPLETQFATNVISIFGGSEILTGIVAFGFFISIILLTRIPMQIAAPLYAVFMLIMIIIIPSLSIIFAIVMALVIASFIYSILWGR